MDDSGVKNQPKELMICKNWRSLNLIRVTTGTYLILNDFLPYSCIPESEPDFEVQCWPTSTCFVGPTACPTGGRRRAESDAVQCRAGENLMINLITKVSY